MPSDDEKFFPSFIGDIEKRSQKLFATKGLPDVLWHYTDFNALLGIIEAKNIWMTDAIHLNDKTEFVHGQELAVSRIRRLEKIVDNSIVSKVQPVLEKFISHDFVPRLYSFSLSTVADDLNQWKAYARNGQGLSIGFKRQGLAKKIVSYESTGGLRPRVLLQKAIYLERKKLSLIDSLIEIYAPTFEIISDALDSGEMNYKDLIEDAATWLQLFSFGVDMWQLVSCFKRDEFVAEKEVRLSHVAVGLKSTDKPFSAPYFRATPQSLIPFYKASHVPNFRVDASDKEQNISEYEAHPFEIEEIMIGPCNEGNMTRNALEMLLVKNGMPHVKVTQSRTPYRI